MRPVRAPSASASFCTIGMFSASLMPRPTETMISAALRSTARCGFAEEFERLGADLCRLQFGRDTSRPAPDPASQLIGAERAGLHGERNTGPAPSKRTSALILPWNSWRTSTSAPLSTRCADHVADQHPAERGRQLRSEVAHLIGVRKEHVTRAGALRSAAAARRCSHPACSPSAARARRRESLSSLYAGQRLRPAAPCRCRATAANTGRPSSAPICCAGGQRFERHLVQLAVALFQNHQNAAHMTLASNLSFSTSFAAASFGGPSKICERFVFSGR